MQKGKISIFATFGGHLDVASGQRLRKLDFYCINTSYLVDRCNCPAPFRSRQMLEKSVLSWVLAGTGSVLFIRQVAV